MNGHIANILTGIVIAIALGFASYYASKGQWRGVVWASVIVIIAATLVVALSIDDYVATRATERAAKVMKPVDRARPWITVKSVKFNLAVGKPMTVHFVMKNTGASPATDVEIKWRTGIQKPALVDLGTMPPLVPHPQRSKGVMVPGDIGEEDSIPTRAITPEILKDLNKGDAGAYAYGVINYRDPAMPDELLETGFCLKAHPGDLGGSPDTYHQGNYLKQGQSYGQPYREKPAGLSSRW